MTATEQKGRHQNHPGTELTQLEPRSNCVDLGTELKRITVGYRLPLAGDGRLGNSGAVMGMGKKEDSWCARVGRTEALAKGDLESYP